jgi:hypothetical protein
MSACCPDHEAWFREKFGEPAKERARVTVYAFDVDETLEVSAGPVTLASMQQLRAEGHVVGLCGNWGLFCAVVNGWQHLVSFINAGVDKVEFLTQLRTYLRADDYVMVGNILGVSGASDDQGAAERAGWRFIRESDFAAGAR